MSCEHKIVDRVASDATVLRDLDSELASFISFDISTQPPRRRRSWSSSMLADGAVETANAYENREITISMRPKPGSTSQQQASDLGTLQRLFASGGKWLKHRPEGVTSPVFYRLLPAEIDFTEYYLTSHPDRDVIFTIPADPFGYGLPETGTATVTNDPTDSNGMRFSITGVKGDVPAPLKVTATSGSNLRLVLLAGTTDAAFNQASPILGIPPPMPPIGPWTISAPSDATAIGGTHVRAATAGGEGNAYGRVGFTAVDPGEYRLFVRARVTAGAGNLLMHLRRGDFDPALPMGSAELASSWRWVDLGVVRLPIDSRISSPWHQSASADVTVHFQFAPNAPASACTVDLDHALLIPAPGADTSTGTLAMGRAPSLGSNLVLVAGGPDDSAFSPAASGYGDRSWSLAGGLPRVEPGVSNRIIFMRSIAPSASTDDKSLSTSFDWSYYPLYLYLRGD